VFRRLDRTDPIEAGRAAGFAVVCLYADGVVPTPLGDLEAALRACAACTFPGIFRPDES
jgi:hypothetical protein